MLQNEKPTGSGVGVYTTVKYLVLLARYWPQKDSTQLNTMSRWDKRSGWLDITGGEENEKVWRNFQTLRIGWSCIDSGSDKFPWSAKSIEIEAEITRVDLSDISAQCSTETAAAFDIVFHAWPKDDYVALIHLIQDYGSFVGASAEGENFLSRIGPVNSWTRNRDGAETWLNVHRHHENESVYNIGYGMNSINSYWEKQRF